MEAFHFCTKLDQTILLGKKATTIRELLEGIRSVPKASIYHHTHRFLQAFHYLTPEPSNDFAYWITDIMNDAVLGEQLASTDIIQFQDIASLRERLTETVESHIAGNGSISRCPPGQEFHFMASRLFVLKTPYVAHNLAELKENLVLVSTNSLYYHMFDAKLRLENGENDFSRWFRSFSKFELANEVDRLDPYSYTLEGLRKRLIILVNKYDKD